MCLEIKTELNDEWAVEKQKEKCRKCVTFWTIFIVLSVLGEPVKKSKKKNYLPASFLFIYLKLLCIIYISSIKLKFYVPAV